MQNLLPGKVKVAEECIIEIYCFVTEVLYLNLKKGNNMGLSKEQLDAINSKIENKLLLAGPGTGKSYTILGFVNYLINDLAVDPEHIFILTFTRTATANLKKEISAELKGMEKLPQIYTLHGFALRQLVKNSKRISMLPSNFVIADDFEERNIILEDLKDMLKISKIKEVKELLNKMASNWETLNADTKDWEQNFDSPEFLGAWKEHREIFGYVLRSELVYQFKNMLESGDDLKIDGPIEYLIVDEYQDLNKCDLRVIQKINERGAKLFCAGDDDQSIYGFRFAYPEGIRNFKKDIKNSDQFLITECRRCDKEILKLALNVIRQDYSRIPKKLESITGSNGETYVLNFRNQNEEAAKIAEIIDILIKDKITTTNEVIILLRTDFNKAFSKVIEAELLEKNIKINTKKGLYNIFDSNVGRFFMAIIKLFENKDNDLALRNLLLLTKGIGTATTSEIYNRAKNNKNRFYEVINDIVCGEIDDIRNCTLVKDKVTAVYKIIEELKTSEDDLGNIIKSILSHCDIETTEFENDLLSLINDYKIDSLSELTSTIIDLFGPAEPLDEKADGVRIMTMHQAKGLTSDAVFIAAAEDEYIPGKGSVDEERRLFYVSLTRARHYLFISNCNNRTGQQQYTGFLKTPSTTVRTLTRYLTGLPGIERTNGNDFSL